MTWQGTTRVGVVCLLIGAVVGIGNGHEAGPHPHGAGASSPGVPKAPIRIGMEELHRQGGVPSGWRFAFPQGDPKAGRDAFAKLECYQCHAIQGESFPQQSSSDTGIGPDLTGMGSHHPAEYFAESILNPNAVIVTGPGYTDADGLSIMPDYRASLTVAELVDLVAYLKSLGGEHAHGSAASHHASHAGHDMLFDQVVGDYRVRVMYHTATGEARADGSHSHGSHGGGAAKALKQPHLMAFIMDARTGEAVPYLPVTLTIPSPKQPARTVNLMPMMGDHGFHYGADITLPKHPAKVTLSIGATSMGVMAAIAGRYSKPQVISFNWAPPQPAKPAREQPLPHSKGTHDTHGTSKGH
ncbi:MAG TPA: iron transporter [Alphaproteobacteria bacterium]|nr:iron transporter [Alphaproteobacteria bacterium]